MFPELWKKTAKPNLPVQSHIFNRRSQQRPQAAAKGQDPHWLPIYQGSARTGPHPREAPRAFQRSKLLPKKQATAQEDPQEAADEDGCSASYQLGKGEQRTAY